jgi:hypothetical protein
MSIAPVASRRTGTPARPEVPATPGVPGAGPGEPRVRHQARDAATVMAFSAATSAGIAAFFLLLAVAARQA